MKKVISVILTLVMAMMVFSVFAEEEEPDMTEKPVLVFEQAEFCYDYTEMDNILLSLRIAGFLEEDWRIDGDILHAPVGPCVLEIPVIETKDKYLLPKFVRFSTGEYICIESIVYYLKQTYNL